MYAKLDESNICIGYTSKETTGGISFVKTGLKWEGAEWIDPKSLGDYKLEVCTTLIKLQAEARIEALDWKVTRATEQPQLYSLPDILADRQAIRDASNQAEIAVNLLTTIDEVKAFTWI